MPGDVSRIFGQVIPGLFLELGATGRLANQGSLGHSYGPNQKADFPAVSQYVTDYV